MPAPMASSVEAARTAISRLIAVLQFCFRRAARPQSECHPGTPLVLSGLPATNLQGPAPRVVWKRNDDRCAGSPRRGAGATLQACLGAGLHLTRIHVPCDI